jgi:hypothetical protein
LTYSEALLGREDLTKKLAGAYTQSVSQQANLLDVVLGPETGDMRLEILGRIKLEALTLEGKELIGRSHSIRKK